MNFHRWATPIWFSAVILFGLGCGQAPGPLDWSRSTGSSAKDSKAGIILAEPSVAADPLAQEGQAKPLTAEAVSPGLGSADQSAPPSNSYLSSIAKSVSQAYESAKSQGLTAATSARDWLLDDLNSGFRWEYRVVSSGEQETGKLESLLNELGRDGWQCFHVQERGAEITFFLQRHPPGISRNIPMSDLLKVLPYLGLNKE